ncbi:hypothetical protein [Rubidibacter lacunae]|uniref:hypothetical protein n=1 Tax=Rubidibacter lacunae TaxID=582514 RepID=UPI0018DE28DD
MKKKRHTRTHLAAMASDRRILVFSVAYPGKANDKSILNAEGWGEWIPDEVIVKGGLGVSGVAEGVRQRGDSTQETEGRTTDGVVES